MIHPDGVVEFFLRDVDHKAAGTTSYAQSRGDSVISKKIGRQRRQLDDRNDEGEANQVARSMFQVRNELYF